MKVLLTTNMLLFFLVIAVALLFLLINLRMRRNTKKPVFPSLGETDELQNINSQNLKTPYTEPNYDLVPKKEPLVEPAYSEPEPEKRKTTSAQDDLIILYLLAKKGDEFSGYDLLQTLLSVGLRFGDMSIFHRHQDANGKGKILFSLANAMEPGIFDMNNMGAFKSKGLILFMQLKDSEHNMQALQLMLETAEHLTEELDAVLTDQKQELLSEDSITMFKRQVEQHLQK